MALHTIGPIQDDPLDTIPRRLKNIYSLPRGTSSEKYDCPYENCGPMVKPYCALKSQNSHRLWYPTLVVQIPITPHCRMS